jgi:hypothetical protein
MAKISLWMITNVTTSQNWKKIKNEKHHTHISNYDKICFQNHSPPITTEEENYGPTTYNVSTNHTMKISTGQIVVAKLTMVQSS